MYAQDVKPGQAVILPRDNGESVVRIIRSNERIPQGDFRRIGWEGIPGVTFRYPILHDFEMSYDVPLPFPESE